MKELRTVSRCNHNVTDVLTKQSVLAMSAFLTKSKSELRYTFPGNCSLEYINNVRIILSRGPVRLFEYFGYEISGNELIIKDWQTFLSADEISDVLAIDTSAAEYTRIEPTSERFPGWLNLQVDALYKFSTYKEYSRNFCPRCAGTGWYVDIFVPNISGAVYNSQKLMQEVIKCLFADETNGFGTQIRNLTGKSYRSEEDFTNSIMKEFEKVEDQITARQNSFISSGGALEENERIDKINILKIAYIRSDDSYQVAIEIIAKDKSITSAEILI